MNVHNWVGEKMDDVFCTPCFRVFVHFNLAKFHNYSKKFLDEDVVTRDSLPMLLRAFIVMPYVL